MKHRKIFIIFVCLLVCIGAACFILTKQHHNDTSTIPTEIRSKSDLETAQKALDAMDIDKAINPAQLDAAINELL